MVGVVREGKMVYDGCGQRRKDGVRWVWSEEWCMMGVVRERKDQQT